MAARDSIQRRVRARVHGRVQGVSFRDATRRRAQELGLAGSARNQPDGTVEIIAEGAADAVEALLDFARVGPPQARVERLEILEEACAGDLEGFGVS